MTKIALADVSIEVAHLYLSTLSEEAIARSAQNAALWVRPIIDAYSAEGLTPSTCVLIDDYWEGIDLRYGPDEAAALIHDECAQSGIAIDHIAFESRLAESVEDMLGVLVPEPSFGAGAAGGGASEPGWLRSSVSQAARIDNDSGADRPVLFGNRRGAHPDVQAPQGNNQPRPGRGRHHIGLDIQLWSPDPDTPGGKVYSCAALAAWWQLVRLGLYRDEDGVPIAHTGVRDPSDTAVPPFAARRTLSVLSHEFLEVEHAVHAILSQLALPSAWIQYLRDGKAEPRADEHLHRIGYILASETFHPYRMTNK